MVSGFVYLTFSNLVKKKIKIKKSSSKKDEKQTIIDVYPMLMEKTNEQKREHHIGLFTHLKS